jgi:CRISPR-associated Csx2 family protein
MKTLITFLGRVRKQDGGDYEKALYRFPDGVHETAYLGLELARHLRPDRVVILGTAGSQWEFLLLQAGTEEALGLAGRLDEAIRQGRLDAQLLDQAGPILSGHLGSEVWLRLIPPGKNRAEQEEILRTIADVAGEGEVDFDVTHGYRHLSMIAFTSAFMLAHIRKIRVRNLWYGALDMKGADRVAPLLELKGLLAIEAWAKALAQYDATGDYGVFADLLREDGFDAAALERLREAAFYERTSDVAGAATSLRRVSGQLKKPLSGASELFRPHLQERLQWAEVDELHDKQKRLAWAYLERKDYLRAAIFGVEACVSRACWLGERDRGKRKTRTISSDDQGKLPLATMMDQSVFAAFKELKLLRNCLAHGFTDEDNWLRSRTDTARKMKDWMRERLQRVLGAASGQWPW